MPFFSAVLVPFLTSLAASAATTAATAGISKLIGGPGGQQRLSEFGQPKDRVKKIPSSEETSAAKIQGLQPSVSLLGGVGEDPAARERRLRMLRGFA